MSAVHEAQLIECGWKVIIDVVLMAIVSAPILVLKLWITPFKRGFYCDDESIAHPYHADTVPLVVLVSILGLQFDGQLSTSAAHLKRNAHIITNDNIDNSVDINYNNTSSSGRNITDSSDSSVDRNCNNISSSGRNITDSSVDRNCNNTSSSSRNITDSSDSSIDRNCNNTSSSGRNITDSSDSSVDRNCNNTSSSSRNITANSDSSIDRNCNNTSSSGRNITDSSDSSVDRNCNNTSSSSRNITDSNDSSIDRNCNNTSSSSRNITDSSDSSIDRNCNNTSSSSRNITDNSDSSIDRNCNNTSSSSRNITDSSDSSIDRNCNNTSSSSCNITDNSDSSIDRNCNNTSSSSRNITDSSDSSIDRNCSNTSSSDRNITNNSDSSVNRNCNNISSSGHNITDSSDSSIDSNCNNISSSGRNITDSSADRNCNNTSSSGCNITDNRGSTHLPWSNWSARKNKDLIREHIVDHNADILFPTETWLSQEEETPVIKELTPSGHRFIGAARPKAKRKANKQNSTKGGGLAITHRRDFKVYKTGDSAVYQSFEYLDVKVITPCSTFTSDMASDLAQLVHIIDGAEVNRNVKQYFEVCCKALDKYAPIITKSRVQVQNARWMTKEINAARLMRRSNEARWIWSLNRLLDHIEHLNHGETFQSAYRLHHSAESALIHIQSDISDALNKNCGVMLIMIDLSAAFDTVDHTTFITLLHDRLTVRGTAQAWFRSYLSERQFSVKFADCQIACVRQYITESACKLAVLGLVISRLDYCNSLPCAAADQQLHKLQLVQNRAARLVVRPRVPRVQIVHITPILKQLHWLPVKQRVRYKLCPIVHNSLHGTGPQYLRELLKLYV
ncbi:hypothetical protein LSAT2_024637 [Lamellibrachia satsuma]|nr:hypothetical protein LSAT2_024637 [Lamellibrachia satsuma]